MLRSGRDGTYVHTHILPVRERTRGFVDRGLVLCFKPDLKKVLTGFCRWYEGGGLMRHNYLVRATPTHFNPTGGAWVHAENITNGG